MGDIRPTILDLYCGAGGSAMGYYRAGFDVFGVDIKPKKHYPFEVIKADALEFLDSVEEWQFDAIHASPPCQKFSVLNSVWNREHPDLIEETRSRLLATGLPFVIENVIRAPLRRDLLLCGSMFG